MRIEELEGQESLFARDSGSGKTSSGRSAAGEILQRVKNGLGQTFKKSSNRSSKLKNHTFMLLDLRQDAGNILGPCWEYDPVWLGSLGTLNTSECPKDVVESSLWQILLDTVPSRYWLSRKACRGMLRRADCRGKLLPKLLEIALSMQGGLIPPGPIPDELKAYHFNQRNEGIYLAEHGITKGTEDNTFSPAQPVTVRQWAVMLCRAYGLETSGETWADLGRSATEQACQKGWLNVTALSATDTRMCRGALYESTLAAAGVPAMTAYSMREEQIYLPTTITCAWAVSFCITTVVLCVADEGGDSGMSDKEKTNGSLAMAPKVITIPATSQESPRRLRVAAYARVSSNSEDQKHSFVAQNAYYSKLITDNPDWELVDVYADKGITGTSIEKREDFLRMMEDCRKGRIDRILVKSSSRFARNAKESLEAVRELKALGVSVYFEEQNIDTSQASGEILTAMFAALAQRESEAISERMRWSYRMRMQKGEFNTCQAPLGFRLNGRSLEVVPEEAQIIQRIFAEYLSGRNSREIARIFNEEHVLGLDWKYKLIDYILRNERYAGNALLQKRYTSDSFPYTKKRNHGEKTQYFVSGINDAIISRETFDKAQDLRSKRKNAQGALHRKISHVIRCACGSRVRAKQINARWYWVCCKHDEEKSCSLMPIPEEQVEQAFCCLYFKLKRHSAEILTQLISDLRTARNGSLLWGEDIVELNKQISDIASQERLLAQLKQQGVVAPDIFISRSNLLAERCRELKLQKERILCL